ncbi:flavin reductase family protein [Labrenzia sp. OB1]|uniref:flavin reductase family protein n=1 Tax=Labrenzia sp. OB1 TaxID=1561204 RepID=UPI0007B2F046|nr:flavin reductase family protein [Labrenzia sp. OB1]KZM50246.1 flavin reductase [Labrenzia sp. OB1]
MFYDPRSEDHGLSHNPWMALIVPRPIAWISTAAKDGRPNLAPYSAFNTVASNPPFVMFSSDGQKHSIANAEATGCFCVNIVSYALREKMNQSSAPFPAEVDEFAAAEVASEPCTNIPCLRVAAAPVSIECRLSQIVDLSPSTGASCNNRVVFGEVVGIHIDESVLRDGKVDIDLMQPLARLGYRDYSVTSRSFEMPRPVPSEH